MKLLFKKSVAYKFGLSLTKEKNKDKLQKIIIWDKSRNLNLKDRHITLLENADSYNHLKIILQFLYKVKHACTVWHNNSTDIYPREMKTYVHKNSYTCLSITNLFIKV